MKNNAAKSGENLANPLVQTLAEVERRAIEDALQACEGNIARAAALLDVAPSTLYRKRQGWIIGPD